MTRSPLKPDEQTLASAKRVAKALLRDLKSNDATAIKRLVAVHPSYRSQPVSGPFKLHQAQLVIARESGFASWPRLKSWFDDQEGRDVRLQIFRFDPDYFRERAAGMLSMLETSDIRARDQVRVFHPRFADVRPDDPEWRNLDAADTQLVVARQHGFDTWPVFESYLGEQGARTQESANPFFRAYGAIEAVDSTELSEILTAHPVVVAQAGTNGNSLLNLASATLVTPDLHQAPSDRNSEIENRFALVEALLAAGAEPDQANHKGWTPLHQAAYSNNIELAERLIGAGATTDLEAYDEGGTPLVVALWWGHCEVAERLARIATTPDNLRVAAGLGRMDGLAGFFDPSGTPIAAAGRDRSFHRPHSGFPAWVPTPGHVQEILDDAFSFAVRSGRIEAIEFLRARGAGMDNVACNGSPLEWAVVKGRSQAVEWLLAHGANVNLKADFAYNRGQTALHSAAFADCPDILDMLIAAGGDLTCRDDAYHSTPLGWSMHLSRTKTRDHIVAAHWERCDVDDLIGAGALLDKISRRLDAVPHQADGWDGSGAPLRIAASTGRQDVVRLLLEKGASADSRNPDGKTARDLAHDAGYEAAVQAIDDFRHH